MIRQRKMKDSLQSQSWLQLTGAAGGWQQQTCSCRLRNDAAALDLSKAEQWQHRDMEEG